MGEEACPAPAQSAGKVTEINLGTAKCRCVPSPGGKTSSGCLRGQLRPARELGEGKAALVQHMQPHGVPCSILEVRSRPAQSCQPGRLVMDACNRHVGEWQAKC